MELTKSELVEVFRWYVAALNSPKMNTDEMASFMVDEDRTRLIDRISTAIGDDVAIEVIDQAIKRIDEKI